MIINCVAYQNGIKLRDLSVEEISDFVCRPDCFVWVAMQDASSSELAKMQEEFNLHPLAIEDARVGHQRPKVEEYGDSLFVVMHLPEFEGSDLKVGEMDIFVGRNYVLSVRNQSTQRFFSVRDRCERESHLLRHGSGFVLYALMDAVVDRYFPVIDALEVELEAVEEGMFSKGNARTNIRRLYDLKRKLTVLRHAVTPLMEASGKLSGGRVPEACVGHDEYFRDVHDHLTRINTTIDGIRDTVGTAIQVNLAMVAIEESEVNKRLAAWAGIFAVATAFAGIWGMNFKAMPELEWTYGYPTALAVIAATCGYLYYRFRRAGWL